MNGFESKSCYTYCARFPKLKQNEVYVEPKDTTSFIMRVMFSFMMLFALTGAGIVINIAFFTQPYPQSQTELVLFTVITIFLFGISIRCLLIPKRSMRLLESDGMYFVTESRKDRTDLPELSPAIVVSEPLVRRFPKWSIRHSTQSRSAVWLRFESKRTNERRYAIIGVCESQSEANELAADWSTLLDCPVEIKDASSGLPTHVVCVG